MAALEAIVNFSWDRVVIRSVNLDFKAVVISSRFITHFVGIPSSGPRGTSTGIPRIVRVIAATVTELLAL